MIAEGPAGGATPTPSSVNPAVGGQQASGIEPGGYGLTAPRIWKLYGLRVRSRFHLPFRTAECVDAFDLEIHHEGGLARSAKPPPAPVFSWKYGADGYLLQYVNTRSERLNFVIPQDGRSVIIQLGIPEWRDASLALLGPAMGTILHLRGYSVMHAASVEVGDEAILLAGISTAGKSTLTAALVAEGAPFLCDDLSPLVLAGPRPRVLPGYPLLKLSTACAAGFGFLRETLTRVFSAPWDHGEWWLEVDKLPGGFAADAKPLRAIYLLAGRCSDLQKPRFADLTSTQGCLALTEHCYGQAWLHRTPKEVLAQCAHIAGQVPVRRVWLPEGLHHSRTSARALIDHAG